MPAKCFYLRMVTNFLELSNDDCHLKPFLNCCHVSVLLSNTVFIRNISLSKSGKLELEMSFGAPTLFISVEYSSGSILNNHCALLDFYGYFCIFMLLSTREHFLIFTLNSSFLISCFITPTYVSISLQALPSLSFGLYPHHWL